MAPSESKEPELGHQLSGRPVQIVRIHQEEDDAPSSAPPPGSSSDSDGDGDAGSAQGDAKDKSAATFSLDEEALAEILMQDDVKDLPVCVVSVAGAFRRGKSFLLDFLLRYLSHSSDAGSDDAAGAAGDWLGSTDSPLSGFHWRGGAERDTTGILMWSKVFPMTTKTGQKVAVVLMDTQGAFDSDSTVRDCATIFALSSMISSVLVYNLTGNIQEDDLQHLGLFTDYGRLALEDSGETPFQKLQFLVRDWSYPYETPFGADGGQAMVARRLEHSGKRTELQDIRKHIRSCFSRIDGFLLPHPGLRVATDPNFDGRVKDIEPMFIEHLREFVPQLLSADNVLVKKIGGNDVRCKELVQFFRAYVDIFQGDEMPEPRSMLKATAEADHRASLTESRDTYMALMRSVCGGEQPYVNEDALDQEHYRSKDQAVEVFSSRRKMGGKEMSQRYLDDLEHMLDEEYADFRAINDAKNLFKAANTPITLGTVAMIVYVLCQFFALVGLYVVANLLNLVMMATFGLLAAWGYVKYTGNAAELGVNIDKLAAYVWDQILQPAFSRCMEEGTQYVARQAVRRVNSTASNRSAHSPKMSKKRN